MNKIINSDLKSEIIDDLGLNELTSIEQDAIINDLEERIIEQLNQIILDRLSQTEKDELELMDNDQDISSFLQRTIPDLEQVKKEASLWVVKKWREDYKKSH